MARGASVSSMERGFNRGSSSIYPLLARTGRIRPLDRVKSDLALTLAEREEILKGLITKVSLRSIGRDLKWYRLSGNELPHDGHSNPYLVLGFQARLTV
jgi:hypothetical protein